MSTTTVTTVRPPVDRVSFSSLTNNNLGTARVLNSTLFPVKYSEKFYKGIVQPEVEDFCKLIYYNDIPVGTVCCRFEEINNETRLYLMTMGVLAVRFMKNKPELGQGSKALQHVLDAAKASEKPKISTVYLHVQCSNEDAKQFYERHGFTGAGLAVDYYKKIEPRDAWILEYKLHTIAAQSEDKPVEGQDVSPSPAA